MPLSTLLIRDQTGQTTTEMAVILALVVIVGFIAVTFFGGSVSSLWNSLTSAYPG
jgi:Flp pilus assembly pilin Flp